MNRTEIIDALRQHEHQLRALGVERLLGRLAGEELPVAMVRLEAGMGSASRPANPDGNGLR